MRRLYGVAAGGREKYPEVAGLAPNRPDLRHSLLSIDAPPFGSRKPTIGGASYFHRVRSGILISEIIYRRKL